MQKPKTFGLRANLFVLSIARNWTRVALSILAVYISLPVIAPTLMRLGLESPARFIYTIYTPFCHQFAFRTFFLYGEQPAYPLAATGTDLKPFEAYIGQSRIPREMATRRIPMPPFNVRGLPEFESTAIGERRIYLNVDEDVTPQSLDEASNFIGVQLAAHDFLGNPQMGYKMTLCGRDIAIYTALFIGGVIYSIPKVRRRLRPVPLYIYIILGVMPIAIDGFSQLLGYPPFNLWPSRETLPIFRVLTGALFGIMNAWLGFPYIDMSMRDIQDEIEMKLESVGYKV
jgi:uncharacterized membrane protein